MASETPPDVPYPKLCDESMSTYEMSDHGFVREIYPNILLPVEWRSLVINTGASHGTLQDIKLPEYSGGYTFGAGGVRRSLFWRVSHDTLELSEESTDVDLVNNHVRLQFPDSPILEGISAHETSSSLVLLVATVSSVHRLRLALSGSATRHRHHHDHHLQQQQPVPSVLQQLTVQQLRQPDSMHVLQGLANAPPAHTAASCLLPTGEAVYFLAGPTGGGQLVRYLSGGPGPLAVSLELQAGSSVVGRLWGLFADGSQQRADGALLLAPNGVDAPEPAAAAVCRDGRLRLWSLARRSQLVELDLLAFLGERGAAAAAGGARRHALRRRRGDGPPLLAAHLCLPEQPVFVLVRAAAVRGAWHLQHVTTVYAPDHALIDFGLTDDALWALWSTAEAETQVRHYSLADGGGAGWQEVALEPPPPPVLPAGSEHLSEAYLRAIFRPGRFQLSSIQRAVSIHSRSPCTETDIRRLRDAVVAAVEADIQRSVPDTQLGADEFNELALAAWEAFHSACLQYHQVGTKPVGLCADAASGQVCVVRRAFVTYLRPAGLLERLWLSEDTEPEDVCHPEDPLGEELKCDVARLVQCCRLLESHLSADLSAAVHQDLAHLVPPDVIAASVVDKISEEPTRAFAEFRDQLTELISAMTSLPAALAKLIELLQVDGEELPPAEGAGAALSGRLGSSLLAASVEQTLRVRFSVASSLVLLETLLLGLSGRCGLRSEDETYIKTRFLPETVIQVQAYFALLWLSETPAEPVSGDRQEAALRQLAALSVQEVTPGSAAAAVPAGRLTLLQLFAAGAGGQAARAACPPAAGLDSLPAQSAALLRLVWPVSRHSELPELLLATCQHAALREYVRLHSTWCDRNSASRCLLRGLALLSLGQPDKACDVFMTSADSVGLDEPLLARLLRLDPDPKEPHSRLLVRYYLRVIRLLELHHLPDYVLELAAAGIAVAEEEDPNVATLWAIAFKYHLRLGHVGEAYEAMTSNPDASSRGDCLRQLVVTLHERRELDTLVTLPYVDMLADVVAILEDRARAADPLTPQFYNVLYAFHVSRSDYRKAAAVMYEWARRLAGEPAGLPRQARCYLACVNALQLVSAEYAWIVRPELAEGGAPAGRVSVLTLEDIRREADLVTAQLRLQEWEARDGGAPAAGVGAVSPQELLARLVAARLYTDAVQVARAHRLSAEPVVRELAAALAAGARDGSAWLWLGRCELPAAAAAAGSAAEQTAALLRDVLSDAPPGDSRLLRAAAERFLQLGRPLPAWLAAEYERRHAAELGRLLLRAGQLEPAGQLLLRLLEALLGAAPERFGLESALHATAPPVWLPYTLLDQVTAELRVHSDKPAYADLQQRLSERLNTYQETLQRTSRDMAVVR